MRLKMYRKDKKAWFVDDKGKQYFRIVDFVQPDHPIIKNLAKGKNIKEISEYWRDQFSYDENPPFRLLVQKDYYILECPDDFTPNKLIEYIAHTKKADCWGGSIFVASLMISQGYYAKVVLGEMVSIHNEAFRWPHAWVEFIYDEGDRVTKQ